MVYYSVILNYADDEHGDTYFIIVSYNHKTKTSKQKAMHKDKMENSLDSDNLSLPFKFTIVSIYLSLNGRKINF